MPGTAARLADVVAGHLHPLVSGGIGEHLLQELAIPALERGPLAQGEASVGDPGGKGVANPLQLPEIEDARLGRESGDAVLDLGAAEGFGEEARQLALHTADLAAQLRPRVALVGLEKQTLELVSMQQGGHR